MMIEVRNKKTGQVHYDSINGEFMIEQGPRYGSPVFEAYPMDKYEVVLLDADKIIGESE